ncbi:hypothetical protein HY224_01415, partial [Candidatus Uhrbacteria bacterium]|nr:hypothetical protein [Candidatus Uhrbacteria bacterium]
MPAAPALIKDDRHTTVFYLATNGRRYVFPNEDTYYSWYGDFREVVKISQEAMASIPIGGVARIRPGTWLVREPFEGKLCWVDSNYVLWWHNHGLVIQQHDPWHHLTKTISESQVGGYKAVQPIPSDEWTADGMLFRTAETGAQVILNDGGRARRVSAAGMKANRFQERFVRGTSYHRLPYGPDLDD